MKTSQDIYHWITLSQIGNANIGDEAPKDEDTWISRTRRYFCVAIPKVACSKIKMVLQQLEGYPLPPKPLRIHFRDTPGLPFVPSLATFNLKEAVDILTSPAWYRFCFVRNPYARLFSAYKSQVMNLASGYKGFRESIRIRAGYATPVGTEPQGVAFRDFVTFISKQPDHKRDGHWRSQTGIVCFDRIEYDFIGRMETFQQDFTKILTHLGAPNTLLDTLDERVNTTAAIPLVATYDRKLADLVYSMYQRDFETFGYNRDSWLCV